MRQKNVIAFFDRLAPHWDADTIRSDEIIDGAGVWPEASVKISSITRK